MNSFQKQPSSLCIIPSCTNEARELHLCEGHFQEALGFQRETEEKKSKRLCQVKGCNRNYRAKGFCHSHHAMFHHRLKQMMKGKVYSRHLPTCSIPSCEEQTYCKNLCSKHYRLQRQIIKEKHTS